MALTLAYELSAVAHERYPHLRWVYTHAHKDNEISRHLMEDIYGCWQVQEVTEVQIGNYVDVVPGSDSPKFGPFSKKGRHSGDGFSVPGRPRTGDRYRDYHHPEGFATARSEAVMADDWYWSGAEWFDNDHPRDASERLATVSTLPAAAGRCPLGGAGLLVRDEGNAADRVIAVRSGAPPEGGWFRRTWTDSLASSAADGPGTRSRGSS